MIYYQLIYPKSTVLLLQVAAIEITYLLLPYGNTEYFSMIRWSHFREINTILLPAPQMQTVKNDYLMF